MRKHLTVIAIICVALFYLTACEKKPTEEEQNGYQEPDVHNISTEDRPEDNKEDNSSQSDPAETEFFLDDSSYIGSEQLPEEITKQIEIYVNQRDIWISELETRSGNYYAWNDLNLDGSLEMICSWYDGGGWYSVSYIYAVNSGGEVERVAEIESDLDESPDLLFGVKLYADAKEDDQTPKHFYILSHDHTRDGSYYHLADMAVTFTAELTEWQKEMFRFCEMEYSDRSDSDFNTKYYNADGEPISQEEWDYLEERFLKDKELIAPDFAWDTLLPYAYDANGDGALSDKELGEALEALYISWQELMP